MSEPTTATNPPAPPAPSSRGASPSPGSEQGGAGFFDLASQELDALDKDPAAQPDAPPKARGSATPPPKPATSAETKSKEDDSGQPTGQKPGDSPAGKSASTATSPGETTKPKPRVRQLEDAYEERKKENATLKAKIAELEGQIKNAKPPEDPEKKTLLERLEEREKKLKELEETIKFRSWEDSDDFKEKYQKPYFSAYERGRNSAAALKVNVKKVINDKGEEEWQTRDGTAKDFDYLMSVGDDQAGKVASAMYGENAALMLAKRERVNEILEANKEAKEEFTKTAESRAKAEVEKRALTEKQAKERMETEAKQFTGFITGDAEKHPEWFKPTDGDTEGNNLLDRGRKLANAVFAKKDGMSREEMIRNDAWAYNAILAFPRVAWQLKRAKSEIESLKADLAKYKESETAGGNGKRTPVADGKRLSDDAELDELDRMGK